MCDLSKINCFIPHCDEGTQTSLCVIQSTGEMLSHAKNKTPPFTCFKFSWVNWLLSWQEPWPYSFLFIYLVRGHSDIVHWWIINRDAINPATLVPLLCHISSTQYNSLYTFASSFCWPAHLYLMMFSSWVQSKVTTNYKEGHHNAFLQNDTWHLSWRVTTTKKSSFLSGRYHLW